MLFRSTGGLLFTLKGHEHAIHLAQFSKDGKKIISVDNESVRIWDASTGNLLKTITDSFMTFQSALLSDNGQKLLVYSQGYEAKLWASIPGLK